MSLSEISGSFLRSEHCGKSDRNLRACLPFRFWFRGSDVSLLGPPQVRLLRVVRTAFGGQTACRNVTEILAREVV